MLDVRPFSPRDKRYMEQVNRNAVPDLPLLSQASEIIRRTRSGEEAAFEPPRITREETAQARNMVPEQFLTALSLARVNLRKFHEYQRQRGYVHDDGDGVRLSRRVLPIARLGVICPDSFVNLLTCAVPAQVAGVGSIAVAATPGEDRKPDPFLLATAHTLGIEEIHLLDSPDAAAAFAFGTSSIPKADKIVGGGDRLTEAVKCLARGSVGIDAPSCLSELAVIADSGANAKFIAADLLAQAMGEGQTCIPALFTTDRLLAEAVRIELARMAEDCPERVMLTLNGCGMLFVCQSLDEAVKAVNRLAPARVELMTADNGECLADIENAGAVFLGPWSPEAVGVSFAGMNPLLPVCGGARYASGLGVDDFVKETTIVEYGAERLLKTGRHLLALAEAAHSPGHVAALRERLELLRLAGE